MAAGTASRTADRCSRSRRSSRHDSGAISALLPLPGAQETGAVGLAGPALRREVLAAASVSVAGIVVVAALAAVTGALAAGALVAVVSAASGEDGDSHARPCGLRSVAAHEPGGKPGRCRVIGVGFAWIMTASAVRSGAASAPLRLCARHDEWGRSLAAERGGRDPAPEGEADGADAQPRRGCHRHLDAPVIAPAPELEVSVEL
jgi:hypothetical protein